MSDLVHVKGLSELNTVFDQLADKLRKNVMRGALRAGMKPIQQDAKAHAAHASGEMAKGLKISAKIKGTVVVASLQSKGKHGYMAKWVEFGTAAHRISAKDGGALAFSGGLVQHVDHPGEAARPFMRPAMDARAADAVVAAAEYIKYRLSTKHGLDTEDIDIGVEE